MHSQTAFLRVRILVGPPRTNISWQTKTKDAGVRRLRPFRQTFFGSSRENIDLKKTVGQLLCMIRVHSLLVQNFCSCSKLTILQWLSQSSYSNTCKNPVIHTSEYVGRTKMHGKNFLKPRKAVLGYLRTWQKNRTKKRSLSTKDISLSSLAAYSNFKKKIFYQRNFWFHSKSQKLCFSAFFYLEIIFSHIFPLLIVPRKAGSVELFLCEAYVNFETGTSNRDAGCTRRPRRPVCVRKS